MVRAALFVAIFSYFHFALTRGCIKTTPTQINIFDTNVSKTIQQFEILEGVTNLVVGELSVDGKKANIISDKAKTYFSLQQNGKTLDLLTTENFGNIDKDAYTPDQSYALLTLQCNIKCDNDQKDLALAVIVTDTNQNKPEFSNPTKYEIKIPNPLSPKTDIGAYLENGAVEATDIDFSNKKITFRIHPADDFDVQSENSQVSKKTFKAVFSTKRTLVLTGDKTYKLTATDSGNPPLHTDVTLVLKIDEKTSLDIPSFQKSSYTFNYVMGEDGKPLLIPTDSDQFILPVTKKAESISEETLTGEYAQYFEASYVDKHFEITVSKNNVLPTVAPSVVVLTLSYKTDMVGRTTILINTKQEKEAIEFNKPFYMVSYNVSQQDINMGEEKIKVAQTHNILHEEINVYLEKGGPYSENFSVKKEGDYYRLYVISPLPEDVIKEESLITLKMKAEMNSMTATAHVIITLPKTVADADIQFDSILYTASIDLSGSLKSDKIRVKTKSPDEEIHVSLSPGDPYSQNFNIIKQEDYYKLNLVTPVAEDVIKKESVITLTVKAEFNLSIVTAPVIVTLPKEVEESGIHFDNILYNASIDLNGKFETDEIRLRTSRPDDEIDVTLLTDFGPYFTVFYDNGIVYISVADNVPVDVFSKKSEILITITAMPKGTPDTASCILNIVVNSVSPDVDDSNITLVILVSILSILLIAFIVITISMWYFKIRKRGNTREEEIVNVPYYKKNLNYSSPSIERETIEKRRPTGFVFANVPTEEKVNDLYQNSNSQKEGLQTVTFSVIPDEENKKENAFEKRRPTGYNFNGVILDDIASDQTESSSELKTTGERQKSVMFDDVVEKLHIDTNSAIESVSSEDEDGDLEVNNNDNENEDAKAKSDKMMYMI